MKDSTEKTNATTQTDELPKAEVFNLQQLDNVNDSLPNPEIIEIENTEIPDVLPTPPAAPLLAKDTEEEMNKELDNDLDQLLTSNKPKNKSASKRKLK